MNAEPRITFVMSAFNAENTIAKAVEYTLNQTVPELELIVFDDGSTDGTAAVLAGIRDGRLRILRSGHNVGRAAGRDACIRAARAEVIAIADADDLSMPHRALHHLAVLAQHPDAQITFGALRCVNSVGTALPAPGFPVLGSDVDQAFHRGQMGIAHPASAFRRRWYAETGGYDRALRWCEDYDLFARGHRPGITIPDPAVLVEYASPGAVRPWNYWWQSERHRRAINARIARHGPRDALSHDPAPFLRAVSGPHHRLQEYLRWLLVSARDTARTAHISAPA